jgi:glyoxylase-like metal-dependent hydrolase (beta-lactamase superfamily II)
MSRNPLLAAIGAVLLAAAAGTSSARAASLPFALKAVGPGIYAAIDGPAGQSGANAGFIVGETGVVVVDAFFSPDAARALLGEIRRVTPLPIRYVVNTHYHADHTGGDSVFREAGAVIIAHRNVRGWVRTENINLLGGAAITPADRTLVAGLALPDEGVSGDLTLWLGDRRVEVRSVKGHTGGDLVIAVPDAHVLFCGDMLWRRVAPNVIDGTVSDWIASVADFAAAPEAAGTRFVPGHGEVADASDVRDFGAYLQMLSKETAAARAMGASADALVPAVLPKLRAVYGKWEGFDDYAPQAVRFMEAELAGTKRRPVPRP